MTYEILSSLSNISLSFFTETSKAEMSNKHDVNLLVNALCNNEMNVDEEDQDYSGSKFSETQPKMRKSKEAGQEDVRKRAEVHWKMNIKSEHEAIRKLPLCCNLNNPT